MYTVGFHGKKLMTPFDTSLYNTGIGEFLRGKLLTVAVCMVRV